MIVFLIDADNMNAPGWIDEACQILVATEGSVSVRRAYGSAENLKGAAQVLGAWAIRPFVNLSLPKNTTDIALAVDAMELACQTPAPSVIAIGSGDADFIPLVVRLRERGIRTICISGRNKIAPEAAHAYEKVVLVGSESEVSSKKSAAKKAAAKTTLPKKAPVKTAQAKKIAPKKDSEHKADDPQSPPAISQILDAAPALKTGQPQPIGDIAKLLHDKKLIGKNAASTKLFKKYPQVFELSPLKQPNTVRYIQ